MSKKAPDLPHQPQDLGTAIASPTKSFFVKMLTRDIELRDAILDLLDNCVDGIIRSSRGCEGSKAKPYEGFHATITLAADHFQIEDNCGGIPIETARKYAFAMGKPAGADENLTAATVGMYGIGMKRAIFKMGLDALVESRCDIGFYVEFKPEWLSNEGWADLPVKKLPDEKLIENGTSIMVLDLYAEVAASFRDNQWVDDFRKVVAQHYSIILDKGFSVLISNGTDAAVAVQPERFQLLRTAEREGGARITPYIYEGKIGDVDVEIFAGLYRRLLTEDEINNEEETRGLTDDAGWTVACNDRVVIWKDRTRLTGWGEATVPNYHGQFIAITGIVLLRSNDLQQLPLTTTKRGIDAASEVYSQVKDLMREATKQLTSFTNKWKKFPEKLEEIYRASQYVDIPTLREEVPGLNFSNSRKLPGIRKFEPKYPEPAQDKTHVVVRFDAPKIDVTFLGNTYFGEDEPFKPGDVGREAFERALKAAGSGSQ